jgi:hypothetical protein
MCCFTIGNVVPEPFFEDFRTKPTKSPSCSSRINKASLLEHFAPIVTFFVYSVELELHDRKVYFAHLLGLTRIDLPFLEYPRSNWVVVIGLELLSHACPGLDLGSYYVTSPYYVTLVNVMIMLILLVWKIGFGVTGMELVGAMPTVQGFVRCDAGSLWIVIIPKSKERFMERPAMRIVQP